MGRWPTTRPTLLPRNHSTVFVPLPWRLGNTQLQFRHVCVHRPCCPVLLNRVYPSSSVGRMQCSLQCRTGSRLAAWARCDRVVSGSTMMDSDYDPSTCSAPPRSHTLDTPGRGAGRGYGVTRGTVAAGQSPTTISNVRQRHDLQSYVLFIAHLQSSSQGQCGCWRSPHGHCGRRIEG